MPSKIKRYGWFPEFILGIVLIISKFIFSRIYHYFPDRKKKKLTPEYPTVYFANHVSETDIPGLSNVHSLFRKPRIKYTIPVREDMIARNFLVKEFKPKGILKYILHLIDLTGALPLLFRIVGAVGVKRPFRDNAKTLMKEGKLRDQVEQDWKILAENIENGKNVMIFPEGAFSDDGYLRQIKNGIAYLAEKRDDLSFFYFNFTYDYLSFRKPAIHIGFGETFRIPSGLSKEEISSQMKERLGKLFTVTPGNLTSFVVLNSQVYVGKTKDWLQDFIETMAKRIHEKGLMYISRTLVDGKDSKLVDRIIDAMIQKKVLNLDASGVLSLGNQYENEREGIRVRKAVKERPFFYHKNQLRYYESSLLELLH